MREKRRHKETAEWKAHVQQITATAATIVVLTGRTTLSMTRELTSDCSSIVLNRKWCIANDSTRLGRSVCGCLAANVILHFVLD